MWAMKHGTDAIECDARSRSAAFRYFGSVVQKHRFNVRPGDVDAFFEDGRQHALVFAHQLMISKNDIGMLPVNPVKSFLDFLAHLL
jgi:hypothetical protein